MATDVRLAQGDLRLLDHPVARELLSSSIPARLAYTWSDGTPRVIPIVFHWNGSELVFGSPPGSPKLRVLRDGARAAVTIDSADFPFHVLMMRGALGLKTVQGVPSEYTAACRRYLGIEAGEGWSAQMGQRFPAMVRMTLRPDWVAVIDFEGRFPSALE